MALYNLTEFLSQLASGTRLLGLDPGGKRIGVALSDVGRRVASPYATLLRGKLKQNAAEIAAIAAREGAGGIVVGLPLDELGRSAQAARDWALARTRAVRDRLRVLRGRGVQRLLHRVQVLRNMVRRSR